MYKPLPPYLTIEKSDIHGLGIFATSDIQIGANLGIAHVELPNFPQEHCRTPLGGFYNHSDEPNCTLIEGTELYQLEPVVKSSTIFLIVKKLFTIQDIKCGHEITCGYSIYQME